MKRVIPIVVLAIIFGVSVLGLFKAQRTWLYVALPLFSLLNLAVAFYYDWRNRQGFDVKANLVIFVSGTLMATGMGPGVIAAASAGGSFYKSLFNDPVTVGLGVLLVALFGGGLFSIRLFARAVYGFTEVVCALSIAAYKFGGLGKPLVDAQPDFIVAVLTAAVYLVVRGLDNIHQGLTKDPRDMLLQWIRSKTLASKTMR